MAPSLTSSVPVQNDEIERLSSERFAVYRRCKLEEIDLPLSEGSLEDIPIEEVRVSALVALRDHLNLTLTPSRSQAVPAAAPMDVDGDEDETQQAMQVVDYGVQVDYEELDDDEREVRATWTSFLHELAR